MHMAAEELTAPRDSLARLGVQNAWRATRFFWGGNGSSSCRIIICASWTIRHWQAVTLASLLGEEIRTLWNEAIGLPN